MMMSLSLQNVLVKKLTRYGVLNWLESLSNDFFVVSGVLFSVNHYSFPCVVSVLSKFG